jgi:IMP dehydrogenase
MVDLHPTLRHKEFWYDDLLLICNNLPDFERDKVDLSTQFSRNIKLKIPFVSSPMDTVTEANMAILMALMGGIGVIHYNYDTIEEQIKEARKVKRFEAAFIREPVVLGPKNTVADVYQIASEYGFYSIPITVDGTLKSKLVGLVTHRDVRYLETKREMAMPLAKIMTPREKLITASKEKTLDKNDIKLVNKIIRNYNLDTLPVVDKNFRLVAIVTDSDLQKNETYTLATKDENKQLKVLIAVESRLPLAKLRIQMAAEEGIDGIVIDSSIVFREQLDIAKYTKKNFPGMEVIVGNIDSAKMVREILKNASKWIDALRVGIGPGAACITQEQLGVGRAQASAVWDCSQETEKLKKNGFKMPVIADGGIKKPSDIVKALALGAQTVMMGSMLAGLEESPGDPQFDQEMGYMVKEYRGMGSLEAMEKRSAVRYMEDKAKIKIPEGKRLKVSYKGSGYTFLPRLIAAVKQSMQKLGCKDISTLAKKAEIIPNRLG